MTHARICAALAAVFLLAGCFDTNPLIGKWKLAKGSDAMCASLDGIEFTDKLVMIQSFTKVAAPVTYSRDGSRYVATTTNGALVFEKNGDGLKMVAPLPCLFARA